MDTELEDLQLEFERVNAAAIVADKRAQNFDKVDMYLLMLIMLIILLLVLLIMMLMLMLMMIMLIMIMLMLMQYECR